MDAAAAAEAEAEASARVAAEAEAQRLADEERRIAADIEAAKANLQRAKTHMTTLMAARGRRLSAAPSSEAAAANGGLGGMGVHGKDIGEAVDARQIDDARAQVRAAAAALERTSREMRRIKARAARVAASGSASGGDGGSGAGASADTGASSFATARWSSVSSGGYGSGGGGSGGSGSWYGAGSHTSLAASLSSVRGELTRRRGSHDTNAAATSAAATSATSAAAATAGAPLSVYAPASVAAPAVVGADAVPLAPASAHPEAHYASATGSRTHVHSHAHTSAYAQPHAAMHTAATHATTPISGGSGPATAAHAMGHMDHMRIGAAPESVQSRDTHRSFFSLDARAPAPQAHAQAHAQTSAQLAAVLSRYLPPEQVRHVLAESQAGVGDTGGAASSAGGDVRRPDPAWAASASGPLSLSMLQSPAPGGVDGTTAAAAATVGGTRAAYVGGASAAAVSHATSAHDDDNEPRGAFTRSRGDSTMASSSAMLSVLLRQRRRAIVDQVRDLAARPAKLTHAASSHSPASASTSAAAAAASAAGPLAGAVPTESSHAYITPVPVHSPEMQALSDLVTLQGRPATTPQYPLPLPPGSGADTGVTGARYKLERALKLFHPALQARVKRLPHEYTLVFVAAAPDALARMALAGLLPSPRGAHVVGSCIDVAEPHWRDWRARQRVYSAASDAGVASMEVGTATGEASRRRRRRDGAVEDAAGMELWGPLDVAAAVGDAGAGAGARAPGAPSLHSLGSSRGSGSGSVWRVVVALACLGKSKLVSAGDAAAAVDIDMASMLAPMPPPPGSPGAFEVGEYHRALRGGSARDIGAALTRALQRARDECGAGRHDGGGGADGGAAGVDSVCVPLAPRAPGAVATLESAGAGALPESHSGELERSLFAVDGTESWRIVPVYLLEYATFV